MMVISAMMDHTAQSPFCFRAFTFISPCPFAPEEFQAMSLPSISTKSRHRMKCATVMQKTQQWKNKQSKRWIMFNALPQSIPTTFREHSISMRS